MVAFSQPSSSICCPRDCISRHNGGTAGAPLKPLRMLELGCENATVGKNGLSTLGSCKSLFIVTTLGLLSLNSKVGYLMRVGEGEGEHTLGRVEESG